MASEPKKKHSKSVKRIRRGAIKLIASALQICKNCGQKTLPHMVCKNCGFYGGKKIKVKQTVKVTKA